MTRIFQQNVFSKWPNGGIAVCFTTESLAFHNYELTIKEAEYLALELLQVTQLTRQMKEEEVEYEASKKKDTLQIIDDYGDITPEDIDYLENKFPAEKYWYCKCCGQEIVADDDDDTICLSCKSEKL